MGKVVDASKTLIVILLGSDRSLQWQLLAVLHKIEVVA
jgi:hypothetical protein